MPIANDPPSEQLESLRSYDEQSLGSMAAVKVPGALAVNVSRSGPRVLSRIAMGQEWHAYPSVMRRLWTARASDPLGRPIARPEPAIAGDACESDLASFWHRSCVLDANRFAHSCFTLRPWAEETGASCPA